MPAAPVDQELRQHARQVALVRLLLVTLGFGVLTILVSGRETAQIEVAADWLRLVLIGALVAAGVLAATVRWVRRPWQLALHLAGDVMWTGIVLYLSGGPASPGVVLLFVIVLTGTLVLPGVFPFVLPSLASLTVAVGGMLYLADQSPFPETFRNQMGWSNPARLLSLLAMQVAALFAVDLLGQLLTRRLRESRVFTGELLDQLGEGVLAVDQRGIVACWRSPPRCRDGAPTSSWSDRWRRCWRCCRRPNARSSNASPDPTTGSSCCVSPSCWTPATAPSAGPCSSPTRRACACWRRTPSGRPISPPWAR